MAKGAEIRCLVKVEKRSKRSVCRPFGIHWDTLVKILEPTEPPGYRQAQPRAQRKIGPFLEVIDQILEGDKKVHRKQQHVAHRIFDRLKDEYGYPGGYPAVKEVVRDRRLRHRQVTVVAGIDEVRPVVDSHLVARHRLQLCELELIDRERRAADRRLKAAKRYRERKAPCGTKTDHIDGWSLADALRFDGHVGDGSSRMIR